MKPRYKSKWIVLLIALLVLAGAYPWIRAVMREKFDRIVCLGQLKCLSSAFQMYMADYDGQLPATIIDLNKYNGGDGNGPLFMCPSAIRRLPREGRPTRTTEIVQHPAYSGYDFLLVSGVETNDITSTDRPLYCDKPGNHGSAGINIMFADGHSSWWKGTLADYAREHALQITVQTNWLGSP